MAVKVLILKGLPASGKSTFARKLVRGEIHDLGGNWKRVNKDDMRAMFDDGKHTKNNENFIITIRNQAILEACLRGINVVVDDTNLNPIHEDNIRSIVPHGTEVEVKTFDLPVKECIRRDLLRPISVGEKVIRQMYQQYMAPKTAIYDPPKDKPFAIIVDIDGTLAHIPEGGRSPYDYNRVHEDIVDPVVFGIVKRYADAKYEVILVSGRESNCRKETEEWLADNRIPYSHLYMRKADDFRNDAIVKLELFDAHIRNNYQVFFVLDDRNRVVDMWRANGLKVLQVAEGDF